MKICVYSSQHSTVISSEWPQMAYSEEGQVSQSARQDVEELKH